MDEPPEFRLDARLASFDEWRAWCAANPQIFDEALIERMVQLIERQGIYLPGLGYAPPAAINIDRRNLRESIGARGISSRGRAVVRVMLARGGQPKVYVQEAYSHFARHVEALFPGSVYSEYRANNGGEVSPNFHVVDVERTPFDDATFDVVVSNDVFEHVANLPDVLREARRILRSGGELIATFPFRLADYEGEQRAVLESEGVRHLKPPEYHHDPLSPDEGALVFQVPGWEILDQCRGSGFQHAEMVVMYSVRDGILASQVAPIFVMRAVA